jgi:PAS domain S-box-containing protein
MIFLCILLIWGTQLIIMPVSIYSSRSVMLDHTRDIMENILDLTLEETRNFFATARGAAHLTERLIASEIVDIDKNIKLERYFCDQLALYPQFAGIYFATPEGAFYYVKREPDPANGVFRFKRIEYDEKGNRMTQLFWRDENLTLLARKVDFNDSYDPRTRPWYKKAVKEKGIVWTDPYIFFSSKKPGITTAGALMDENGNLRGVVGVDIELDVLSEFVGNLRVGKTGMAFIVNRNTEVIAFPGLSRQLKKAELEALNLRLPRLNELETPLCKQAYESVDKSQSSKRASTLKTKAFSSFEAENKIYYTMFTRVDGQNISWMVGVYLPEEDYLGAIITNQQRTFALTFLASIAATIGGLLFARRITEPVLALDQEARKINRDDYSKGPRIKSCFGEIQRTADSFFEMKTAVETYKKELRRKETIHRAITDTANEAIIMKDEQGIISYWNPAAAALFGYGRDEALGCRTKDLFPFCRQFNDKEVSLFSLFGDGADFKEVKTMEILISHRNGSQIPGEISMVTIPLDGKPHAIAVIRDIRNRKKAEAEKLAIWRKLQQARKMEAIGTLAGGIAHDFNNILSGILGHAELLELELRGNKNEHIEGIVAAGERARDLVRQILTFSFQENRKLILLDLPGIIDEACSLLSSSLPKNIQIDRMIDGACPPVLGDATQIHQVALNLMTNAFQAMEPYGGRLSVRLTPVSLDASSSLLGEMDLKPGPYIRYSVSDTGVGISPQAMDRIFDPYFTTKPEGRGTGLGLAVIKGIVQNHGGGIHVESTVGQGSLFSVFFPVAATQKAQSSLPGPERVERGNEHILLVDDQKSVIDVERQILEVLGYRVTSRLSGQEALDIFKKDPDAFDLVVTDMSMPGMTGDELGKELVSIRPGMPVILLTGYSEAINPDRARQMGIRTLILKPVRLKEFSIVIRRELDRRA